MDSMAREVLKSRNPLVRTPSRRVRARSRCGVSRRRLPEHRPAEKEGEYQDRGRSRSRSSTRAWPRSTSSFRATSIARPPSMRRTPLPTRGVPQGCMAAIREGAVRRRRTPTPPSPRHEEIRRLESTAADFAMKHSRHAGPDTVVAHERQAHARHQFTSCGGPGPDRVAEWSSRAASPLPWRRR